MTFRKRVVTIKQLPESIDVRQAKLWVREMEPLLHAQRPCMVLDCSRVRNMNREMIYLLLCCLEEAMKHNGDVKLAGLHPEAHRMLAIARTDRLFEIWPTEADAIASFQRLALDSISTGEECEIAKNAA